MARPVSSAFVRRGPSDWLGAAFVAVIWVLFLVGQIFDIQSFVWFLVTFATYVVVALLFVGWWFTRRSFTWGQRFLVFGGALLAGAVVVRLCAHSIQPPIYLMLFGMPIVLVAWVGWVLGTSGRAPRPRSGGLIACVAIASCALLCVRVSGLQGNMRADVHWRWTPTAEETFLAQHPMRIAGASTLPSARRLELKPGDWPGFRGANRDGAVHGLSIAVDWAKSPPRVLWRQRVGPAWSSMAVVDGCVFTQEQRGDREAVVCRDALTGDESWVHDEPSRFEEAMAGPGPRATPTFADGRIYAQGAVGTLNCLDAGKGQLIWSRDLRRDAGAALPMWGFSGSPLVADGRVIVFAGGEAHKGLLAYSSLDGNPLWMADAGKVSYSSPQAFNVGGEQQVIIFTNEGLFAVDPATGHLRWQFPVAPSVGLPSTLQACQVGPDSVLIGNGMAFGLERLRIAAADQSPTRQWVTRRMKPAFSDMVLHDGFVYGFDGTVFCCTDPNTGERQWRDGRYGAGQVLLLAEQGVMIVTTEDGQVVLLRCNPQRNEELGRLSAITGKAWNHAAIAQDRLYVRSDAEMACLQLGAIPPRRITQAQ